MVKELRINERIYEKKIRVIGDNNEQLDIMLTREAMEIAKEKGLDLVEISPNANPSVCKIMNYGKYKFDQSKKEKEAKKKQKIIQIKEIKLRVGIGENDFKIKIKNIQKFLKEGDKVKITVMFRGREMAHPEIGKNICNKIIEILDNNINIEKDPKNEGRNIIMILSPKNI